MGNLKKCSRYGMNVTALFVIIVQMVGCGSISRRNEATQASEAEAVENAELSNASIQNQPEHMSGSANDARYEQLSKALSKAQMRIEELEARLSSLTVTVNNTKTVVENVAGPSKVPSEGIGSHSDGVPVGSHSDGVPAHSDGVPAHSDGVPAHSDGVRVAGHNSGGSGASHAKEKAVASPGAATTSSSDEVTNLFSSAMNTFRRSDFAEAIPQFQAARDADTKHVLAGAAQYYLGESYLNLGEMKLAAGEYKRVLENFGSGPKVPAAIVRISQIYEATGDLTMAQKYRAAAEKHFPDHPAFELTLPKAAVSKSVKPNHGQINAKSDQDATAAALTPMAPAASVAAEKSDTSVREVTRSPASKLDDEEEDDDDE